MFLRIFYNKYFFMKKRVTVQPDQNGIGEM